MPPIPDSFLSRQRTEVYTLASTLLGIGAVATSNRLEAEGYNSVQVLVRADRAFTVRVFNSNNGTNWVLTEIEASAIDAVSGESVVSLSAAITGLFARVTITNTSGVAMTTFDPRAYLIPHGGAGGGGGGGGGGFAADTRDATTDANFAAALIGMLTNTRTGSLDNATSDYRRNHGDSLAFTSAGVAQALVYGEWVMAMTHGYSLTGAGTAVPVEARIPVNVDATLAASGPMSLAVNSQMFARDSSDGTLRLLESYLTTAAQPALGTVETRESGYADMVRGRRFSFTHQTPGTQTTAQAAFAATTPTLLWYNSVGNTSVVGLRTARIDVLSVSTVPVLVTLMLDTADRFSAGGTVVVGQNWNEASATAYPGTAFRFNATASAAGGGTRYLGTFSIPAGAGQSLTFNSKDGIQITGVGSIGVYVYDSAATTAPSIIFTGEVYAYA